jgi:hypothetical protein
LLASIEKTLAIWVEIEKKANAENRGGRKKA